LRVVKTARNPSDGRSDGGRFARGNRISVGAGWKRAVAKFLGREVSDPAVAQVARDAVRLNNAALAELPNDGANVRMLVALQARHAAMAAYFTDQAVTLGLMTEEGQAA